MKAFFLLIIVGAAGLLAGCDDPPIGGPQVILIRGGIMEKSGVGKYSDHCWVAWYKGIEHIILKRDGTADDSPFHYKWEPLDHAERDAGTAAFFDKNGCKE